MGFSDLPEELLFDIFTRLPVRSIIRLRCVSKSFHTLTRTPRFVSHHLKHNKIKISDSTWLEDHGNHFFYSKDVSPLDIYQLLPANKIFPPFMENPCLVLAHCNGLFCLNSRTLGVPQPTLTLYNPATRESRLLPQSNFESPPYKVPLPTQYSFGFGFDPKTEDHKVIKIVVLQKKNKSESHIQFAEVYSLSTNSWRIIDQALCDIPIYRGNLIDQTKNIYANGAVHWYANPLEKHTILSFDTSLEVFRKTMLPDKYLAPQHLRDYLYNDCTLCLFNDQLAIVCGLYKRWENGGPQTCFEVWVLKNSFGDLDDRWSRLVTVEEAFLGHWSSLGFWKNGEIIFVGSKGLRFSTNPVLLYDPATKQVRDLQHSGKIHFIYKESLVPLKLQLDDDHPY